VEPVLSPSSVPARSSTAHSPATTPSSEQPQGGLLRGWFPGWSGWGWYGGQAPPPEAAEHSPSQEHVDDTLDEAQFGRICLTSFNCAIK
jgi:hypothetical protein